MTINLTLFDGNDEIIEKNAIVDVEDRYNFSYKDSKDNLCEMHIYDDGLCLKKHSLDYALELNMHENNYVKIITREGEIKFDIKVVDFIKNDDILVMRYIVENEERKIEIIFRS